MIEGSDARSDAEHWLPAMMFSLIRSQSFQQKEVILPKLGGN